MELISFAHKGLKLLHQENTARSFSPDAATKLRVMFTILEAMKDAEVLKTYPLWKAHQLKGDRKGVWSLHVTGNYRLTFRIENDQILDLNYEDYH